VIVIVNNYNHVFKIVLKTDFKYPRPAPARLTSLKLLLKRTLKLCVWRMCCSLSLCLPKALRLTLYEAERLRGDGLEAHSVRDSDM
jgi:hypothetical protein